MVELARDALKPLAHFRVGEQKDPSLLLGRFAFTADALKKPVESLYQAYVMSPSGRPGPSWSPELGLLRDLVGSRSGPLVERRGRAQAGGRGRIERLLCVLLKAPRFWTDDVRVSRDTWDTNQNLPPRPDETPSSGAQQPVLPPPAGRSQPSRLMKVGGAIMMVLGVLLTLGGAASLAEKDASAPRGAVYVMLVLTLATFAGGRHFYRNGWQHGRDVLNVMAVLPIAVLTVLIAVGVIARATQPKPPTDAHGYTAAERQLLITGCGGGARCTCLVDAVERSIPHDQFVAENQKYLETGNFSPEMTNKLAQLYQASGC